MDSIYIDRLSIETHIGITQEERSTPQKLEVSVELFADTAKAGASDSINDTIDYNEVCKTVKRLAGTKRNTIEKLARDVADTVLADFKPEYVKVAVWKYILPDTKGVAVTIVRPSS